MVNTRLQFSYAGARSRIFVLFLPHSLRTGSDIRKYGTSTP